MKRTLTATTISITCTFGELCTWESCGIKIYAIPYLNTHRVAEIYAADQARFKYDWIVARPYDFYHAAGYDTLGWEDMSQEEYDAACENSETFTLEIPREEK